MKKILGMVFIAMLVTSIGMVEKGWAAWKVVAPGLTAPQIAEVENALNTKFGDMKNLGIGLANANSYSSHAANQNGFLGYELFAITGGIMLGGQLPSFEPSKLKKIDDDIKNDGDVYMGVGVGAAVNIGVNLGEIFSLFGSDLVGKDWYANVKFFSLKQKFGSNFETEMMTFGLGLDYRFINGFDVIAGMFKWRGLFFGSGLLVNTNNAHFKAPAFGISTPSGVTLDSKLDIGFDTTTYTIPLEAKTAMRLLWILNISAGVGADLTVGDNKIIINQQSAVSVLGVSAGTASITQNSTKEPYLFRPKLMAGLGLELMVVVIDLQATWYLWSGLNLGISAGIVW